MATRESLTEKERWQVQRAYYAGIDEMEARKKVIQDLFGRDITRASCLANAEAEPGPSPTSTYARSIKEAEFWDLLCCAAFNQKIWEYPSADGDIRKWVFDHCALMGRIDRHEGSPRKEAFRVPPSIPKNWKINTIRFVKLYIVKLIGPGILILYGFLLERIANVLFP